MTDAHAARRGRVALVTGGAGFIGSHLVDALLAAGRRVRVFDNLTTGTLANLRQDQRLEFAHGDVRDPDALHHAAADCDIAFHLAGIVGMHLAHRSAIDSHCIADEGTLNLLEATGLHPCVLFSSSCVYGLRDSGTCREDDPLSASAVLDYDGAERGYASGKLALERHGQQAARKGRDIIIVRPFNVVGSRQSASYGMVLPRFVRQAREGHVLTVYGNGEQSRCFSDVDAFVQVVTSLCAPRRRLENAPLVVNVGSDVSTSINSLARTVIEQVGGPAILRHVPFEDVFPGRRDVQCRVPCNVKFDRMFGRVHWSSVERIVRNLLTTMPADATPAVQQA